MNRHTHDERLTEPQRDAVDASYDALRNRGVGAGGGGGGGVGAAGAVMVPMIIIGSIVVFMLYACFYPVGAVVALLTGVLVSRVFDALVPGVGWMAHYLVMLPLAFSALMLFQQRVEWRLEQKRGYVVGRHVLRLVFTAVIVGLSISFIGGIDQLRERQPLDGYSWLHFVLVAAAVVLVHFVGRWQDRRLVLESRDTPAHMAEPASPGRSRTLIPGMALMPPPLGRGMPVMTLVGGAFGAFLGYAGFETATSTLVGLFAGCVGGALLMFVCWLITRPVGALFDRIPLLWPLLMGAIIGAGVAVRLAQADKGPISTYLVSGIIGGALVLAVPYLLYSAVRRMTRRTA